MSDTPTAPEQPSAVIPAADAAKEKELSQAFKKLGVQPPKVRDSHKKGFMNGESGLRHRAEKQDHKHVFMKPVKIEAARRRR